MSRITPFPPLAIGLLCLLGPNSLRAQERMHTAWEWGFHGTVLMNAFYNDAMVNASDDPAFAVVPVGGGPLPQRNLGGEIRQSRIVGTGDLAGFGGGALHAELDVDFFGAQSGVFTRTGPALRVRRLFGEVKWDRLSLLIGQESPLVADVNPVSLAALGVPNYAAAGNLWLWIPQIRAGIDLNGGSGLRFGVDVAALSPTTPEGQTFGLSNPSAFETSGRPALESRIRARWGDGGEISVGGHVAWYSAVFGDSLFTTDALVATAIVPLGANLELRGEGYTGKGTAFLGGGGIGQLTSTGGSPLKSSGGWAQLNLKAGPHWEVGAGVGMDDPHGSASDEATTTFKTKNTQYSSRLQWRLAPAVVAFEYRRLATTYGGGIGERAATHLNLAFGVEF